MRRIFIAVALIVISVISGIFIKGDIVKRSVKHIKKIHLIEKYINDKDFTGAEIIAEKTADEFNFIDSKVMYNYYHHKDISEIAENMYCMRGYLNRKKLNEYYYISGITKNRLQSIIDKEEVNLRNVL